MEFPTIFPAIDSIGSEKRITRRLRKYWNYLREDRQFPEEKEINPSDLTDIWNNCFIVKADNSCKKEDYKYKYLGVNIIRAYGHDLTGLNVSSLAAPGAEALSEKYEQVLAFKRPVIDEGEINISKNKIVKYRQILLPFGDFGVHITAILGGMSYKIIEKKSRFSLFGK